MAHAIDFVVFDFRASEIPAGATIIRRYRDEDHLVEVVAHRNRYRYRGRGYRSLAQVQRAITGGTVIDKNYEEWFGLRGGRLWWQRHRDKQERGERIR